jgi:hypothetical protein
MGRDEAKKVDVGTRLYVAPGTTIKSAISGKTFKLTVNRILGLDYDNLLEEGKVYRVVKRENGLYLCPVGMSAITDEELLDVFLETEIVDCPRYSASKQTKEELRKRIVAHVSRVNHQFLNVCLLTRSLLEEITVSYIYAESDFSVKRLFEKMEGGNEKLKTMAKSVEVKIKRSMIEEARRKNG